MPALLAGLLWLALAAPAAGQDAVRWSAQEQLSFAQRLLDQGEYYRAVTEFSRFLHFFQDTEKADRALYGLGMAYLSGGKAGKAEQAFVDLSQQYPDSPLALKALILACGARVAGGAPEQGEACLSALAESENPSLAAPARYYLGFVRARLGEFDKARQAFASTDMEGGGPFRVPGVSSALDPADNLPYKNPTAAGVLAAMPGAGHAYLGRYQDAAMALFVNAAFAVATWQAFDEDLWALGALTGTVGLGFYAGSIHGAVTGAKKHNDRVTAQFAESLAARHSGPAKEAGYPPPALFITIPF
ncbi:MAG: tetratricopeptide repeat protein [Deltaproteobacteria bacterium]|nr:tetratricopeptide repeat protein [Deltaproteobacteria bacterium]